LKESSEIYPLDFKRSEKAMFGFPRNPQSFTEGCLIKNEDSEVLVLANPSKEKEQLQFFHKGFWWYIEMLPDTSATVVFENE
jgi:hypothetical protein